MKARWQKIVVFFLCLFLTRSIPVLGSSTEAKNRAVTEYDLNELCKVALQHSETIKIATEAVNISKQDKKKALSVIYPKLTAFGNYSKYDETTERTPDTIAWGARFDYSFTINANELNLLRGANDMIVKSEYDQDTAKQEYLYGVIVAYFEVAKAGLGISISKINVDRLEKHKAAVLSRLNVGEMTRTGLFRANAELSTAKTALVRSQNGLKYARAVLARLAGIPDTFILKEPNLAEMQPLTDTLETLTQEAFLNRTDLKAYEKENDATLNNIKYKEGEYWPRLTLEGAYTNSELNLPYVNPVTQIENDITLRDDSVMFGAKLSFLFYDGGSRKAEIHQARAENRIVNLGMENQKNQIALEVKEAYLNVMSQKSVLESLETQLVSSKEHFNAVSKEFKFGLVNSLDVVDANSLLSNTEREIADARYSYKLAEIQLKRAKGTLLNDMTAQ